MAPQQRCATAVKVPEFNTEQKPPQNMSFVPTVNAVEAPFMNFSSDQGSNSFSCSDFSWENDIKTPDITSV
uniref:Uncharacterized protein n=1 Tax=Aegilops tauschii subsp. strangulata TaxID=200361 RepID=A0A453R0I2_AEGTS